MLLFQSTRGEMNLRTVSSDVLIKACKEAKNYQVKGFTKNPEFQRYFGELMRRMEIGNWRAEERKK